MEPSTRPWRFLINRTSVQTAVTGEPHSLIRDMADRTGLTKMPPQSAG